MNDLVKPNVMKYHYERRQKWIRNEFVIFPRIQERASYRTAFQRKIDRAIGITDRLFLRLIKGKPRI